MSSTTKSFHEIVDDRHLDETLARIDQIFLAARGTPEGEELEGLVDAVVRFENERYPMEIEAPGAGGGGRDFELEMALLPPHLRQAACVATGFPYDMDWSGREAAEFAFATAGERDEVKRLEEAVRALSDFCGLETVVYGAEDLESPNGFPWFVGSLFEGDRPLPIEDQPSPRGVNPSADEEALASRMMLRSRMGREQALDWIHGHVIPAYGTTAAMVMQEHGLGEMLDFFDALDAGVHQ